MILHVQHQDFHYDYVGPRVLDKLIATKGILSFFRPSEERWVNVFRDPIRRAGDGYSGPKRRQSEFPISSN